MRWKFSFWVLVNLVWLSFAGFLHGEEVEDSKARWDLTLKDCVLMALDHNNDITLERLNYQLDEAAILQAQGDFDPRLTLRPNYTENSTPLNAESSVAAGGRTSTKSRNTNLQGGIEGKIPMGTTYQFGFNSADSQNTFNSFRDQYTSFWGLTLTQPLLKGFGPTSQLEGIRIARKNSQITREAFADRVSNLIMDIQTAYWNLCFAVKNREVRMKALELAAKTLRDNRLRAEIGVMTQLDVIQAESGVAQRELQLVQANQEIQTRMNALKGLISNDYLGIRDREIWPVDEPMIEEPSQMKWENMVASAMEHRHDYQQAKLAVERSHLQLVYNKDQGFPQVDLNGSYGFNGIGGSFPKSFSAEDDRWAVGLAVVIPLPDRASEGRIQTAEIQKEKSILQLKILEQTLMKDVSDAWNQLESQFQRFKASQTATHAAEATLQAANGRLKTGTLTSFEVLQIQNAESEAQSALWRSRIDLSIANAQLQKVTGLLIHNFHIQIQELH